MKKTLLVMAFAVAGIASIGSAVAGTATGTMNFAGTVSAATCDVDTVSIEAMVLPIINEKELSKGAGTTGPIKDVDIKITNCPATISNVSAMISGTEDVTHPGLLAIDHAEGAASGLAIQFTQFGTIALDLNKQSSPKELVDGNATLALGARYFATGDIVQPGEVHAAAQVTVIYK